MFFDQERGQFFRPLTSKYRAQVLECLKELYQRLYSSSSADYGQALQRDVVIEIFQEALVRAPILADGEDDDDNDNAKSGSKIGAKDSRFRNSREQAGWVLNQLLDFGWMEKQVDEATLQSTFAFSRYGRQFVDPFITESRASARTRHRNTRNTRNSLEAFLERGEVYDLLDAYEYSERIISDFTDVISELEERKRDLVREMDSTILVQRASEEFFDFMEKRFQPDLAVRLSADNVEKHRDRISELLDQVRNKNKAFKAKTEGSLRDLLPELVQPGASVLWTILDGIEQRIRNASDIMLPALRKALQGFTKRADIIIRQMSYLASQQHNDVLSVCKRLAELTPEDQNAQLMAAGQLMSVPEVALVDPAQVRLAPPRKRRFIEADLDEGTEAFDMDARKDIYIQQVLDQAFFINNISLRSYMQKHLMAGKVISTKDLPIENANDFLAVANAVSLASTSSLSSDFEFVMNYEVDDTSESNDHKIDENSYFTKKDHFTVELINSGPRNQAGAQ
ncbi:MAG TPA: flagellar protein FliT [Oceanospirillales bacterium]|nr:flagellar protein FliT [Oleispira sp.]HCM06112.1 flagellar protein FliT [Oceanospirillales bacterium]|tara:strand:- start:736 stop:2265 length:1530 start_codon:yes stop_codon:yes gene_type:complete